MLYRIMSAGGVEVNGTSGLRVVVEEGTAGAVSAAQQQQQRSGRYPLRIGTTFNARRLPFTVWRDGSAPEENRLNLPAYNGLVNRAFEVGSVAPLVIEVWQDDDDPEYDEPTLLAAHAEVVSLRPDGELWRGEWAIPNPLWFAVDETEVTTSPVTLGGTSPTRPVLHVTTEANATRTRVTVRDRSGQGTGGAFVAIPWGAAAGNTRVWVDGLSQPFRVTGGRLWFRVDVEAGRPTFVDCYASAAISNTDTANALLDEGTTLDADLAAGTSVTASTGGASAHGASANNTWHMGRVAAHEERTTYTFGLTGDREITMRERDGTGERVSLDDDWDAFVFSASSELTSLTGLTIKVVAGYLPAVGQEEDEEPSPIVDRRRPVQTMRADAGAVVTRVQFQTRGGVNWFWKDPHVRREMLMRFGGAEARISTFYETIADQQFLAGGGGGDSMVVIGKKPWDTDDEITEVTIDLTQDAVNGIIGGGAALSGSWPTFYITYPQGSFEGGEIPLPTFTSNLEPACLVEARWWDTDLDEPIMDGTLESIGTGNVDDPTTPTVGSVRAIVRYQRRDDERWHLAWSREVIGQPQSATELPPWLSRLFPSASLNSGASSIAVPNLSIPGALRVAVGIEPIGDRQNTVTWGTLEVLSDPAFTYQSGTMPGVDISDAVTARVLDGEVRSTTTGDWLRFDEVCCDTGLTVDTEVEDIPELHYGAIRQRRAHAMFRLLPGENEWQTTGHLEVTMTAVERYQL